MHPKPGSAQQQQLRVHHSEQAAVQPLLLLCCCNVFTPHKKQHQPEGISPVRALAHGTLQYGGTDCCCIAHM